MVLPLNMSGFRQPTRGVAVVVGNLLAVGQTRELNVHRVVAVEQQDCALLRDQPTMLEISRIVQDRARAMHPALRNQQITREENALFPAFVVRLLTRLAEAWRHHDKADHAGDPHRLDQANARICA